MVTTPIHDGHSMPIRDGHSTRIRDGHSTPIRDGHSTPIRDGHSTPIHDGHPPVNTATFITQITCLFPMVTFTLMTFQNKKTLSAKMNGQP